MNTPTMIKRVTAGIISAGSLLLPTVVLAVANETIEVSEGLRGTGEFLIDFINSTVVPFLFAAAFVVFVTMIIYYFILKGNDDDARKTGKTVLGYGLAGFVIALSVWGLVNLLVNTFNLDQRNLDATLPAAPSAR